MRTRALVLVPLLALALAAGCGSGGGGGGGGGGGSTADASSIVPAAALAFFTLTTDTGSDQLTSAEKVIDKFPIKQRALTELKADARKNGVDFDRLLATVGPVLDVAVLRTGGTTGVVGFAKPSDEQGFDAQLKDLKHTTVDGWTVFAQTQALLDAVSSRTASLADNATYKDGVGSLPATGETIARAYAPGTSLQTASSLAGSQVPGGLGSLAQGSKPAWITGALTSQDGSSFKLETHFKLANGAAAATGKGSLVDQIPSDAIVALSTTGGAAKALPAGTEAQLGTLTQQLGIDLPSLIGILEGPVIAYVRQGTLIPEVTLAAKPPDAAGSSAAIRSLVTRLVLTHGGSIKKLSVSGVELNSVVVGPITLYWGTFNGELVITDTAAALSALKNGPSSKLTDDAQFKDAASAAGMPDSNQGFLYVDVKDALPMVDGIATLAGSNLPPAVRNNLQPLKSLLLYGSRDGDIQTAVVDLQTN